jgi:four helix bundle protein
MATAREFEELDIWKGSRELVRIIYTMTSKRPLCSDWPLRDQLRRSAISVMSNIAEGFDRGSRKEFIQFLHIAKGSSGELRSQLYAALDQSYLPESDFARARTLTKSLSRRIAGFIRYLEAYPASSRIRGPLKSRSKVSIRTAASPAPVSRHDDQQSATSNQEPLQGIHQPAISN